MPLSEGERGKDERGTSGTLYAKIAAHCYPQCSFIYGLLPALRKAHDDGEVAKVISLVGGRRIKLVVTNDGSPCVVPSVTPPCISLRCVSFALFSPIVHYPLSPSH